MPALLDIVSPQLIGANHQEFLNRAALSLCPHLKLPISFGTADAAVLFTVPALNNGAAGLEINSLYWEITTSFTGGSSAAIGVSSAATGYSTKGDFLGGSGGDVLATLVSTGLKYKGGTIGAKFGSNGKVVLVEGDVIRFDRITSAFTAGAGFVHVCTSYVD